MLPPLPPQLVMADLEADLRKVMAPHTAPRLRESKRNVLRDFVHIAGPLGVTHFLILTATQRASYLRIAKSPRVSGVGRCAASTCMAHVMHVMQTVLCDIKAERRRDLLGSGRHTTCRQQGHDDTCAMRGHRCERCVCRCLQGPTLTMRVHEYALMRDVAGAQPRPRAPSSLWAAPPLLVMNNFGEASFVRAAQPLHAGGKFQWATHVKSPTIALSYW
jgi:Brix domain